MSALIASVEASGDILAETVVAPGHRRVTMVGRAGAGKAAALRHAHHALDGAVPSILLEASEDDLAPVNLLNALAAGLEAVGHRPPPTDDADRSPWSDLVRRCSVSLDRAADERLIVLLSGVDQLQRLSDGGGAPGHHAADFLGLLNQHAPRLGTTTTAARGGDAHVIDVSPRDLGDWLADEEVWGDLAAAAARVAERGAAWRRLPALSIRLAVALAHLDELPTLPPATPLLAGRLVAQALASQRRGRPVWAAWQLVANLRGPLADSAMPVLLQDLPLGFNEDPLLRRCLLFWHDGWHLHPILRQVARFRPPIAAERRLPEDLLRSVGRRMVDHFRGQSAELAVNGEHAQSAAATGAALDASAMAQDPALVEDLTAEVPDPFDHIGRRSARDPVRSHSAFARARSIDELDATALRGLADADDRQAVDAARVEQLFRLVVKLEPQDVESHVRLMGVLLAAGRPQAAIEAFDAAAATLAGLLDEDLLAERLLVPVARMAIAAGHLPLASRAAAAARGAARVEDAKELDRMVEALVEALEYGEFVAPHRLGTRWWQTPDVLADFDSGRRPLSRWLAARVEAVDESSATMHYADVSMPSAVEQRPARFWTTMTLHDMRRLSLDRLPDPLPSTILEIGIYGDGERDGSTVIRVAAAEPIVLPAATLPLDRYARDPT